MDNIKTQKKLNYGNLLFLRNMCVISYISHYQKRNIIKFQFGGFITMRVCENEQKLDFQKKIMVQHHLLITR